MATTTSTPRKATRARTPKPADVETVEEGREADANGLLREVYALTDKGRTRGGEGKETYWNIHESGARGQIFTAPDVVEVKVLIIRNPNAAV